MKIGVITVHNSSNCGSFLQAFGMKSFLESLGHEVYFINTRDEGYVKKLFYDNALLLRSVIKWPLIGVKRYLFARKKYKIFQQESTSIFNVVSREELDTFDILVLGSDEIWNIKTKVFSDKIFYGNDKTNVIAYAVSSGRAKYEDYLAYEDIIASMQKVNCVMVRDESTKTITEKLLKKEVPCVCDPTMLINPDEYITDIDDKLKNQKYLLIYAYDVDKNLKKHILKYARMHKLKIVSAGFFCMWADYNVNCKSIQLFSLAKNAECVFTTTFHGSIFSLLSKSKFVCCPGGSVSKVSDLLLRMQLTEQMIESNVDYHIFEKKLNSEIDYVKTNWLINDYRQKSSRLFKESIRAQEEKINNV